MTTSLMQSSLIRFHWLRVPERVQYKLAVMTYKVLFGGATSYLGLFVCVADLPGRRALRSAGSTRLVVPPVKLTNSRHSSLFGRCSPTLEQPARRHRCGRFDVDLSAPTETLSVPAVLPRCCTVSWATVTDCNCCSTALL